MSFVVILIYIFDSLSLRLSDVKIKFVVKLWFIRTKFRNNFKSEILIAVALLNMKDYNKL